MPLHRTMRAVRGSVPVLRTAVADFAAQAGASEHVVEALRLAISEAVTNVVLHAYVGAVQPGWVRVEAQVDGARLAITVTDRGLGMVPRLDSPGLGLGLALIAHAADNLDVHDVAGGGTELRMTFPLDG